jgi:hypothetical protein
MPARPPLRVTLAVGLVAACTLAMQVLLTRLFSAVLFYHFAFFSISLALLGTGAGALLIYLRPRWFAGRPAEALLARWSVVLAALLVAVPALIVRLDYSTDLTVTFSLVRTLALAALLAALPFLAAGIVIALAIQRYVASVGRVYAFDLAGAGLGALAVVPLLRVESAPVLLVALGALAGAAALLFGWSERTERMLGAAAAAAAAALTAVAAATSLYYLDAPFERGFDREPVGDRWTPTARTVGYPPERQFEAALTYDQDFAPVPHRRPGEPPPAWERLELGPQSIGYVVTGPGDALIVGGGGGRDIYNALSERQRVDVIELNRGNRDVVENELAAYSGRPYTYPGVDTAIGDGRSIIASRDRDYDQIHIGFTNTLAANLGAAYALSENHLYTVEAFDEYLDHLKPGGILNVSRPYRFTGEEALRTTVIALETLRRRGVDDPERHVVTVLGRAKNGLFGTVLARLEPFTEGELALIRRLAEERDHARPGEAGVVYAPGGPHRREWAGLARAESPEEFCEDYRSNVCAPTDDKPFFLNPTRLQDVFEPAPAGATFLSRTPFFVLLSVLGILAVLCALAFALPLALVRSPGRPPVPSLLFFAAIGLGFLVLEVVLIQRFVLFLGFPTYALSVVLFSLLVFTGAGAWLSARFTDPPRALVVALSAAIVLIGLAAFALQPLLEALIDLPFAARVALSVALLAPVGLALGMAMPIGLRRLSGLHPEGVPWAWSINGVTSVLASVLALVVAINWGFTAATLVALVCYVGALVHVLAGRWPESEPPAAARTSSASRTRKAAQATAIAPQ